MLLNLGVVDVAYGGARPSSGANTTGEVAEILEARYAVMETFFEMRKDKIANWLAESVGDAIADLVSGSNAHRDPFYGAMQKIEAEFRSWLSANEMAQLFGSLTESEQQYFIDKTGGFTGAASRGVNHRLKNPYSSKNKERPAFVDTGLYRASFRSWVTDDPKEGK